MNPSVNTAEKQQECRAAGPRGRDKHAQLHTPAGASAHTQQRRSQRQHKLRITQPRDPLLGATREEIGQSGFSSGVMTTLSMSTTVVQHLLLVRDHLLVHLAGFPRRHMLPVSPSSSVCFSSCSVAPGCCAPPLSPHPTPSVCSSISPFVSREGKKAGLCNKCYRWHDKGRDKRCELASVVCLSQFKRAHMSPFSSVT